MTDRKVSNRPRSLNLKVCLAFGLFVVLAITVVLLSKRRDQRVYAERLVESLEQRDAEAVMEFVEESELKLFGINMDIGTQFLNKYTFKNVRVIPQQCDLSTHRMGPVTAYVLYTRLESLHGSNESFASEIVLPSGGA